MNLITLATSVICCCILSTVINAQKCGNVWVNNTGSLQSLNYPFPLEAKTVCNWSFALTDQTIKLVYLNVETVELADDDELSIFDGITTYVYFGANLTKNLMFVLNPIGSTVRIITMNESESPRKFMASYRSTGLSGKKATMYAQERTELIKSPLYSSRNETMDFTWIITKTIDTSVYLTFRSFNISDGNLTIFDGDNNLTFTGSQLPRDIATTSANVRVNLVMPLEEPDLAFELFHRQLHPNCSQLIQLINETEYCVNFTDLPKSEDHPVSCFIIVEGPENVVLSAGISAPDVAVPDSKTLITLNDGGSSFSPVILVYSPSVQLEVPRDALTSGSRLWIGYRSAPQKQPLNMSVHITVHNSGQHLHGSGSFQLQPTNATLVTNTSVYLLSVDSNEQVIATVDSNTSLSLDNRILFYDAATEEKLLANLTASSTFYPIVSTSNQLRIVAMNFKGNDSFSASFIAALKGRNFFSSDRSGSFQLNRVDANGTYTWIIAPLEMNSSVELIALTIHGSSLDSARFLQIYSGSSNNSSVLYTLTKSVATVVIHINSANGARVVFHNDADTASGLFVDASYQIQTKVDYSLNLTTNATIISSPNYPSTYPANAQCQWTLTSPSNKVHLTFEDLDLPSTQPVLIYSTKDQKKILIANISGKGIVDDVITDQAPLLLEWSSSSPSDNLTVSTGFQIKAFSIDCGSIYTDVGTAQTPKFPEAEKNSTLCVWAILLPPIKDKNVEIIDLSYESGNLKKSSADLIIHEGGSLQSPSANMSAINQTKFLSRTNKLLIRYMYEEDSTGGMAYKFSFNAHPCTEGLCANGICMHNSWRCNGVNDCEDFSDEKNCAASPIVPTPESVPGGVSVAAFVVMMFVMLGLGVVIAIFGPVLWRRFRSQRNYQEFRNTADA